MNGIISTNRIYITTIFIISYIGSLAFLTSIGISFVPDQIFIPEFIFILYFPLILFKKQFSIINWDRLDWLLILYLSSNLISSFISKNEASIIESCGKIYLFMIYLLSKQFFKYKNAENYLYITITILLWFLVFTGLIGLSLALFGISSKYVYYYPNYPYFGTVFRLQGMTPSPTMFISILSCFLFIYWEKIISTDGQIKLWSKILLSISAISIFLTYSKSIILLLLGVILLLFRFSKLQFGILIVSTTLFMFFSTNFYIENSENSVNKEVINTQPLYKFGKYNVYETIYLSRKRVLLNQFLKNPFWGLGVGNTNSQLADYKKSGTYPETFDSNCDPSCTYLGTLAETGIIGFLICLLIGWHLISLITNALKKDGIAYGIAVCFVIGSIEALNTDMLNFRHYWVLLGFLTILSTNSKNIDSFSIK